MKHLSKGINKISNKFHHKKDVTERRPNDTSSVDSSKIFLCWDSSDLPICSHYSQQQSFRSSWWVVSAAFGLLHDSWKHHSTGAPVSEQVCWIFLVPFNPFIDMVLHKFTSEQQEILDCQRKAASSPENQHAQLQIITPSLFPPDRLQLEVVCQRVHTAYWCLMAFSIPLGQPRVSISKCNSCVVTVTSRPIIVDISYQKHGSQCWY